MVINIANEFSRVPAGRYLSDGPYSGEKFRQMLLPLLRNQDEIIVELDGTAGYPSSFLEEAFGGLVRKEHFRADDLRRKLRIVARDHGYQSYVGAIWRHIETADAGRKKADDGLGVQ